MPLLRFLCYSWNRKFFKNRKCFYLIIIQNFIKLWKKFINYCTSNIIVFQYLYKRLSSYLIKSERRRQSYMLEAKNFKLCHENTIIYAILNRFCELIYHEHLCHLFCVYKNKHYFISQNTWNWKFESNTFNFFLCILLVI